MSSEDYTLLWHEALACLEKELGEAEFNRWFRAVAYKGATEKTVTLEVPSNFYRDQMQARYKGRIEAALKAASGTETAVVFAVAAVSSDTRGPGARERGAPPAVPPVSPAPPVRETPRKARHPQLREEYSFERYVIGDNNKFAANAAVAISRNAGVVYNPFLIYGGVGLGKTHLMQAIGSYAYTHSDRKIIYSTAECFTNEFIQAIRDGSMPAFKNKYRFADMLLLDDIHFLENKWETQEELFHTFNALYDADRHIIFTCDRPASDLKKINERLRSRFERGLNVDLQPPDYETRCAILKSKARCRNTAVPDEVIALIAENIATNVRDLEAALTRVTAYTELFGAPLTLESARAQLRDFFPGASRAAAASVRPFSSAPPSGR
ncbi:MAG: chromosomal replication initiator protein DnaA, partial [Spirochaetaceae bacterium]|nr:chromosomal replication initiator protein DnaA [Spirochaetaceae bacterium]